MSTSSGEVQCVVPRGCTVNRKLDDVFVLIFSCSAEESTNTYINSNWRPVADSLHPILVKTIEDILYVVLKQLFDSVPADYFIGDIKNHMDEFSAAMVSKNIVARHSGNTTSSSGASAVLAGIAPTTTKTVQA